MVDFRMASDFSCELAGGDTGSDLDQRLGLYRVFVKLYEHHRWLLDEILDLENSSSRTPLNLSARFVQGVIWDRQVYLISNLLTDSTQLFCQPQGIWTIGRDRAMAFSIPDKRLSRRHAAIQHVENEGFYLIDLNSTNGTFVNGEPIRHCVRLKDGDKVRLGSLSFLFFACCANTNLPLLAASEVAEISAVRCQGVARAETPTGSETTAPAMTNPDEAEPPRGVDETSMFLISRSEL